MGAHPFEELGFDGRSLVDAERHPDLFRIKHNRGSQLHASGKIQVIR